MWLLDTDHLSLLLQGHPVIEQRVATVDPQTLATTIVTVEEQLRGRLNLIRRASDAARLNGLVGAYIGLQSTLDDLKQFNILNFTQAAHVYYTELLRQRIRIGTRDLRIAAIALSVNATVLTRNRRDFAQVPGLNLEDWTTVSSDS